MKCLLIVLLPVLTACSVSRPVQTAIYSVPVDNNAAQGDEKLSWWAYRYRIAWPEKIEEPDFAIDLLLAHALVRPVLIENSARLQWWRFHRRASRKPPGHQFSFLFYCDRATAIEVIKQLDEAAILAVMKDNGLIDMTVASDIEKVAETAIESYSDPSWSPAIQRTWPNYIMGVSAFWLALIDDLKAEQTKDDESKPTTTDENIEGNVAVKKLLDDYRRIDDQIAEMWQLEGQHALLHHLSAVFGYKPMMFRKDIIY